MNNGWWGFPETRGTPKKMLEMVENPDLEMDDDWG